MIYHNFNTTNACYIAYNTKIIINYVINRKCFIFEITIFDTLEWYMGVFVMIVIAAIVVLGVDDKNCLNSQKNYCTLIFIRFFIIIACISTDLKIIASRHQLPFNNLSTTTNQPFSNHSLSTQCAITVPSLTPQQERHHKSFRNVSLLTIQLLCICLLMYVCI